MRAPFLGNPPSLPSSFDHFKQGPLSFVTTFVNLTPPPSPLPRPRSPQTCLAPSQLLHVVSLSGLAFAKNPGSPNENLPQVSLLTSQDTRPNATRIYRLRRLQKKIRFLFFRTTSATRPRGAEDNRGLISLRVAAVAVQGVQQHRRTQLLPFGAPCIILLPERAQ